MIEPPPIKSLAALREAEEKCTRCPLYKNATQVVPGEGPRRARIMLVGEQPAIRKIGRVDPLSVPQAACCPKRSKMPNSTVS